MAELNRNYFQRIRFFKKDKHLGVHTLFPQANEGIDFLDFIKMPSPEELRKLKEERDNK